MAQLFCSSRVVVQLEPAQWQLTSFRWRPVVTQLSIEINGRIETVNPLSHRQQVVLKREWHPALIAIARLHCACYNSALVLNQLIRPTALAAVPHNFLLRRAKQWKPDYVIKNREIGRAEGKTDCTDRYFTNRLASKIQCQGILFKLGHLLIKINICVCN